MRKGKQPMKPMSEKVKTIFDSSPQKVNTSVNGCPKNEVTTTIRDHQGIALRQQHADHELYTSLERAESKSAASYLSSKDYEHSEAYQCHQRSRSNLAMSNVNLKDYGYRLPYYYPMQHQLNMGSPYPAALVLPLSPLWSPGISPTFGRFFNYPTFHQTVPTDAMENFSQRKDNVRMTESTCSTGCSLNDLAQCEQRAQANIPMSNCAISSTVLS